MSFFVTLKSLAADGDVYSYGSYAAARAGSGSFLVDTSGPNASAGQVKDWGGAGVDIIAESFLAFDLTGISETILSATLRLFGQNDGVDDPYVLEARVHDWGATVTSGDWIPGASLAAKTLIASIDTAGWNNAGWNALTSEAGFVAALTPGSVFRLVLVGADTTNNVAPTDREIVAYRQGDHADGPELILELDGPAIAVAGSQPSGSGALASLVIESELIQGSQAAASGRVLATQLPIRGRQGAPFGVLSSFAGPPTARHVVRLEVGSLSGSVWSSAGAYGDAIDGGSFFVTTDWWFGQALGFTAYEAFARVFSAMCPAGEELVAATFSTPTSEAYGGVEVETAELRAYPGWSGTLEWLPGDDIEAATTLVATATLTPGQAVGAWTVDVEALSGVLNLGGYTNLILVTSSQRLQVEPTESAVGLIFTAAPPVLTLTYTGKLLAGAQPGGAGTLTPQWIIAHRVLAGAQPAPSGAISSLKTVFGPLAGNQPAASGVLAIVEDFHPALVLPVGRAVVAGARLLAGRAKALRPGR